MSKHQVLMKVVNSSSWLSGQQYLIHTKYFLSKLIGFQSWSRSESGVVGVNTSYLHNDTDLTSFNSVASHLHLSTHQNILFMYGSVSPFQHPMSVKLEFNHVRCGGRRVKKGFSSDLTWIFSLISTLSSLMHWRSFCLELQNRKVNTFASLCSN